MSAIYAVYGFSGFGRDVMPLVRQMMFDGVLGSEGDELVFVDDAVTQATRLVNGHRVLTYAELLQQEHEKKHVSMAIADGQIRMRLVEKTTEHGILPFSVVARNAVVFAESEIGHGAILCGFSHITANVVIGRYFHANIYSYVEHDCRVGDFVTLAPGAKINGNVVLEDYCYVGSGAVIKQGVPGAPLVIGKGAIVGMGAVVTRSVAPGAVVVGNPARPVGGQRND